MLEPGLTDLFIFLLQNKTLNKLIKEKGNFYNTNKCDVIKKRKEREISKIKSDDIFPNSSRVEKSEITHATNKKNNR